MKVFTVIVSYNAEHLIIECLNSVLDSSITISVIVVDNFSDDNTVRIIKGKFPNVQVVENEKNLGFGIANNIGISIAIKNQADYVFLLNQDAFPEKNTIEKLVEIANENNDYGIISPVHLNEKGTAIDVNWVNYYLTNDKCPEFISDSYLRKMKNLYCVDFVNAAAWLVSKKCIETVGGFNPYYFMYGEDEDYCNRLHFNDLKIGISSQTTVRHIRNNSSAQKTSYYKKKRQIQAGFFLGYRIALTNVGNSIGKPLLSLSINVLKRVFRNLLYLNFSDVYLYLYGYYQIIIGLGRIKRSRKISRIGDFPFLKNSFNNYF